MTAVNPVWSAPKKGTCCIFCEKEYDIFQGGVVWDGHKAQCIFICASCAPGVIPGMVKDLMSMDCYLHINKRRAKYIIDAGKTLENMLGCLD